MPSPTRAQPGRRWRPPRGPAATLSLDVAAVAIAAADVLLVVPAHARLYSNILSGIACAALVLRRRLPAVVLAATIPGMLVGWSEIAAMIALGTVAFRHGRNWRTVLAGLAVWSCRFLIWPPPQFIQETWREHALDGIYGIVVAGMPIAVGLFAAARKDLAARIGELAESRQRQRGLIVQTVRAQERNEIAREMHDVVSHEVTLIAIQASALQVVAQRPEAEHIANTITTLCTRTLDELRELIGVLRTDHGDKANPTGHRGLTALTKLTEESGASLQAPPGLLAAAIPPATATAAYRTVQEALTNAHKYAPGSPITVDVSRVGGQLRVEVRNEGTDRETAARDGDRCAFPSGGNGLAGLAERANLVGGVLVTGRTDDGGFLVRATLPLPLQLDVAEES